MSCSGPEPDVNFGGVKNSHDRMCVHTQDNIDYHNWGKGESS